MTLIWSKGHSKCDNQRRMKINVGRAKQSFSFGYSALIKNQRLWVVWRCQWSEQLLDNAYDQNQRGDKYDDKGVIRCSNYKNATIGLYELGCVEVVNLLVGLIQSILMKVLNKKEMKMLLVLTFSNWFKSFLPTIERISCSSTWHIY